MTYSEDRYCEYVSCAMTSWPILDFSRNTQMESMFLDCMISFSNLLFFFLISNYWGYRESVAVPLKLKESSKIIQTPFSECFSGDLHIFCNPTAEISNRWQKLYVVSQFALWKRHEKKSNDLTEKYESYHVYLLSLSTWAAFSLGMSLSLSTPQGI